MNIWIIGDTHFNHKLLTDIEKRPHLKYLYCKNKLLTATNGASLFGIKIDLEDGWYTPELDKVLIDNDYPDYKDIISTNGSTFLCNIPNELIYSANIILSIKEKFPNDLLTLNPEQFNLIPDKGEPYSVYYKSNKMPIVFVGENIIGAIMVMKIDISLDQTEPIFKQEEENILMRKF